MILFNCTMSRHQNIAKCHQSQRDMHWTVIYQLAMDIGIFDEILWDFLHAKCTFNSYFSLRLEKVASCQTPSSILCHHLTRTPNAPLLAPENYYITLLEHHILPVNAKSTFTQNTIWCASLGCITSCASCIAVLKVWTLFTSKQGWWCTVDALLHQEGKGRRAQCSVDAMLLHQKGGQTSICGKNLNASPLSSTLMHGPVKDDK